MEDFDIIDRNILNELQNNSHLTTKELAAKVNLSPTPVFERVKRLEKDGFIKRYIALLNAEKLGNGFIVFCFVRLKQHSKANGMNFANAIAAMPEVTECYNISGDYDFMMKVYAKDMRHYQDFVLNKLGSVDSIGALHSQFVMGEMKNTHTVPF
jgi:Lrp/AsnC family transcriptional regulator, leucine-responsive regulatory protein